MKTKSFFCCAILSIVIVSCVKEPQPIRVSSITLNSSSLELVEGESADLVATISPKEADNQTVLWSSSNGSVASVSNNGKIDALAPGSSTITAKSDDGGFAASCYVTVVAKTIEVSSISLSLTELTLTEGDSETVTATVKPDDATDKTVIWSSSAPAVATVDGGKITAVKEGEATIAAKAGDKTAACKVTVEKKIIAVETVELDKNELELTEGDSATLVATVKPDDATDKGVTWSSSDPEVATVEDGAVTAVKEGTATLTAKAGEKSATCVVTVKKKVIAVESVELDKTELTLTEGESITLVATVYPENATDKTITWNSSDKTVVSINEGLVIANKEGIAIITARAGEKTASCTITIERGKSIVFDDPNFKSYCINHFDLDGDNEISKQEALKIESINCSRMGVQSLSGIEYFTNLKELDCSGNIIEILNVGNNTALLRLVCNNNRIKRLDLTNCPEITYLDCGDNAIFPFEIKNCFALTYLDCSTNRITLTSLDLSQCPDLSELRCNGITIDNLILRGCHSLTYLECRYSSLKTLDISNCPSLSYLNIVGNKLKELDAKDCSALTFIECYNNSLTNLNVSGCSMLSHLNCVKNKLTNLDLSGCPKLTGLYCFSNQLINIDLSNCVELTALECYDNHLTHLDFSHSTSLLSVLCSNNDIQSVETGNNKVLTELDCSYNLISSLILSGLPSLKTLNCRNNLLTSLDLSKNPVISMLNCYENPNLSVIWLKSGQTIKDLYYDNSITTIKYKD